MSRCYGDEGNRLMKFSVDRERRRDDTITIKRIPPIFMCFGLMYCCLYWYTTELLSSCLSISCINEPISFGIISLPNYHIGRCFFLLQMLLRVQTPRLDSFYTRSWQITSNDQNITCTYGTVCTQCKTITSHSSRQNKLPMKSMIIDEKLG